eukprot:scaffold5455_cov145-Skeletonema_menzelii.AAC.18
MGGIQRNGSKCLCLGPTKGIALLLCTFSFTVFFSSCVATILEKVNGSESDTLKKCCKMWSGVVVLRLARHATSKHFKNFNFTLEETECFVSAIPPSIYVAIGVAMTAMDIKNGVVKDWMTAVSACFWRFNLRRR